MSQLTVREESSGLAGAHPLVSRITKLRGRVRSVLGLYGAGFCVTAAVAGMAALMLADYLMPMPGYLRLLLLIAGVVALGVTVWRKVFLPLSTRLTDQFLASRVEQLHGGLGIMADDAMAGVYANLALRAVLLLAARGLHWTL